MANTFCIRGDTLVTMPLTKTIYIDWDKLELPPPGGQPDINTASGRPLKCCTRPQVITCNFKVQNGNFGAELATLSSQSVEISWFFYHLNFTWNQNWGSFRSAKSAILAYLKALNLDLMHFLHYFRYTKFTAPKVAKSGSFITSRFSKIDFT